MSRKDKISAVILKAEGLKNLSSEILRPKSGLRMTTKRGFVSLVGAGPGDPKLLTLRGREALEQSDVVIYDYLAHPSLLKMAPKARHLYVGKKGGDPHSTPQTSIETLIVRLAKQGKRVVRLKGGDPFIFGRGGEEALVLAKHQIPFEIIPGITAGIAAPAYAGIPVTHRGLAAEVTFITGHEDPLKDQTDINWKAVAGLSGTLVLFMGVKTLPKISGLLIGYGKPKTTPVSVIQWGSTAGQKVVTGTLENIAAKVEAAKLTPPSLTVIGRVNELRNQLNWFESKPLFGKTVLITRSRNQSSQLAEQLDFLGAQVLELPTIEISPIHPNPKLDRAIRDIDGYDWFVFTSENGVDSFFERLKSLHLDARILNSTKIAAIGPGTGSKLESYSVRPDLVPKKTFTTEGLLAAFKKVHLSKKKILLLRTNIAPKLLYHSLRARGAQVSEIAVYKTKKPKDLSRQICRLLDRYSVDYVTFTSSSTAENFLKALTVPLHHAKIISIGPVTSKTIRDCGFKVNREANVSTISGLVDAVLKENRNGKS